MEEPTTPIISPTLPADGENIDASDVNNPIRAILDLVNGGLDSDNMSPTVTFVFNELDTDTINEKTSGSGVTIDGLLVKDSKLSTNNSVPGNALATDAIKIGYAEVTAQQTPIATSTETDLTGLSVTVTVPAGGRDLEIIGRVALSCTSTTFASVAIKEGSTYLGTQQIWIGNTANPFSCSSIARVSAPSAGSHTYNLRAFFGAGTGTMYADSSAFRGFILVKII